MPSTLHEFLVGMFRDRPSLVADVLAGPLGVSVPAFAQAQVTSADLTDTAPTEYRADAVITLTNGNGDAPALAVVVEVQLRSDSGKRLSWPVYVTTLYARLRCPVTLLWCARTPGSPPAVPNRSCSADRPASSPLWYSAHR
jgi:hypothetical protein